MMKRKKWLKFSFEILIAIALFIGVSLFLTRGMLPTASTIAPFKLAQLSSNEVELVEWDKHDKTLVYFFAPWCSVCRISMPTLSLFSNKNIQVIAIALDWSSIEEVSKFVEGVGYKGKVLLGTEQIKNTFQVDAYPSYYVTDNSGKISHRDRGLSTPPGLWLRLNGP